jgi:hypothetical protein
MQISSGEQTLTAAGPSRILTAFPFPLSRTNFLISYEYRQIVLFANDSPVKTLPNHKKLVRDLQSVATLRSPDKSGRSTSYLFSKEHAPFNKHRKNNQEKTRIFIGQDKE